MATRTPAPRPDTAPEPQDHKKPAEESGTIFTVELDGHQITANFSAFTNVRLMRKVRKDDFDAILDLFEQAFPDLDTVEEQFDLVDITDYLAFITRVQEAVPNSQS